MVSCKFDGRKCNSDQKCNNNLNASLKKPIKQYVCKEDDAWNSSTCVFEFNKYYEIDEYLKNLTLCNVRTCLDKF